MKYNLTNEIKNILLITSLFSFLFLWDLKYNFFLQARFLIILYLVYVIFYKIDNYRNELIKILVIFSFLFFHQFINILFEHYNNDFQLINNFNDLIKETYPITVREIYQLNNNYSITQLLPVVGFILCFLLCRFSYQTIDNLIYPLVLLFIILFFVFDFIFNLNNMIFLSNWDLSILCTSFITYSDKTFMFFLENSHYGMIFPSVFIYMIYVISKNNSLFNYFILLLLIISAFLSISATLMLGLFISLIFINIINFKNINFRFRILSFLSIVIILLYSIYSKPCMSRFQTVLQLVDLKNYNFNFNKEIEVTKSKDTLENIDIVENIIVTLDNTLKKEDIKEYTEDIKRIDFIQNSSISSNRNLLILANQFLLSNDVDSNKLILNKFINNGYTNLTAEVFINSINLAINSLIDRPLGWGINRFHNAFTYYQPRLVVIYKEIRTLNYNDGSSNFSKLLVEFGIFSFILFYFYFVFAFSRRINVSEKLFLLPFIITQMIRGAGYFNGGFMLITLLIVYKVIKLRKK